MASPLAANAQTSVPPNAAPTRDEITRPVAPETPTRGRVRIDGDIERSPCPLADPAYAKVRVTVDRATFGGLKRVTAEELLPAYQALLGADRPVSVICDIRDAVATALRRRGYLAAVQVPVQKITGGEVHFEVLFARLVAIRVRGDAGASERLVGGYLEKLTHDEVFNQQEAERYLLLARDLPGTDIHLALKPTGKPGEIYGEVTITRTPIEADFNLQNLGSPDTGRYGGQARLLLNGLTGLGDQTTIAFYSTAEFREQQVLQLGHEFRVGSEGLKLGGHFTYAWTRPDLAPAQDLVHARTLFANVEARYPLVRTLASTLSAAGGLDFVNQDVRFDTVKIARDRLRVAYLRLDSDLLDRRTLPDPQWHLAASLELRQGLAILDATRWPKGGGAPPSRNDGDAQATVLRGSVLTDMRILPNVTWSTTMTAQHSFSPLLSFEEYSAGNYTIGRGYDPGTLIGDDGVGVSTELRLDKWTPVAKPIVVQPFVFADAAVVGNKRLGRDKLLSFGAGVRATFADRFRLDMTLAVPTRAAGLQHRNRDPRLLVSFTTKLWPWGNR